MSKILGIGNALVDILTGIGSDEILDRLRLPKGSMTLVDSFRSIELREATKKYRKSIASGGSAANTIHGLGKLGTLSGYIGSTGKDETGNFFEKDMQNAGVKTYLIRRDTETGTAIALITPDSERTFATHLGAAIELTGDDLNSDQFDDYDLLYLEGYLINNKELVEKACDLARKAGMEIALDLASYNVVETHLEDFSYIISKYVDILFANEEEARAYTGLDTEKAMEKISEQIQITVIKTGSQGSLVKRKEELIRIDAVPVKCVDTTGAGDLYAAGFLYGYLNDQPLSKCGAMGSLLASNVIDLMGARIPDSRWPEIKNKVSDIINR
ncbi:MAG TPA: adenosine kinase [Bacteroidales bacterium]|nr:adenosine kinase [Bacteroidales bacterium]